MALKGTAISKFATAHDLVTAHDAFSTWLFNDALPFWAGPGFDGPGLGAREFLNFDGTPGDSPYKRVRVQARQIYVFSHASLLGWKEGENLARDAYRFINLKGERPAGGWVRRLSPDGGTVLDPVIDLYDQAFVLFALAWYARAARDVEPLERARRTAEWIVQNMALKPAGFANEMPLDASLRQQNPHMHLLEAMLALYETSSDKWYAQQAEKIVELFKNYLFDYRSGALGELFNSDWSPAPGEAGDKVEPGHLYEWVWLLSKYEQQIGSDLSSEIKTLYDFALDFGTDPKTGLVWDEIGRDGSIKSRALRVWPQTEALKAHCAMFHRERITEQKIVQLVRALGEHFLADAPPGAWIDRLDASGASAVNAIPTSTFYHILMAYGELNNLV